MVIKLDFLGPSYHSSPLSYIVKCTISLNDKNAVLCMILAMVHELTALKFDSIICFI